MRKREEGKEEEKVRDFQQDTPYHFYVCSISHFYVSSQEMMSCASLSAVFRNNGMAELIEN